MTGPDPNVDEWSACESALDNAAVAGPNQADKLNLLRMLHRLRDDGGDPPTIPQCNATTLEVQRLGRFEVHREIGRGSFGVVYLALDPQLGREVALKVPHPEVLMTPNLCGRFRQEAQVAAALDHPNVIAVHEVGEEGAFCYLVSPYCPGGNLADWLREHREPMPFDAAAALIRALAAAVHHAHERGIIHRDLKPANLLIADCGLGIADFQSTTGNLQSAIKITDFGLAKYVDGSGAATRTGAVVGTPLYMAPEQATAGHKDVGPAIDIYALGAMLYELLTGRTPFTGETALDILYEVRNREPLSPRQLRPRIPRDLETICLKCLEKNPAHRYPSAAALADDLGRFLDGHPVHARPIGPLGKSWRWAQRRPTIVVLIVGLFLSLVGGSIGMFTQWRRAELQTDETQIEHDRADANYHRARELTDRLTKLSDELTDQPGLDKTRQNLLEEALAHSEAFLRERGADPRLRREVAQTAYRTANLRRLLGQREAALAAFERAVQLFAELSGETPDDAELRSNLAKCWLGRGIVHEDAINPPAALVEFDKAIAILEPLVDQHSDRLADRHALVNALTRKAQMQRIRKPFTGTRSLDAAAATLAHADEVFGPPQKPPTPSWRVIRASVDEAWAALLSQSEKSFTDRMNSSLEQRRALVQAEPAVAAHRYYLARSLYCFVEPRKRVDDIVGARAFATEAVSLLEQLIRDFPAVLVYRREASMAHGLLAGVESSVHQYEPAIKARQRAYDLMRELADEYPNDEMYRSLTINRLVNLAVVLTSAGRHAEAVANYRQLVAIKKDPSATNEIAWLLATTPDINLRDCKEAVRLASALVEEFPLQARYRTTLAAARLGGGDVSGALNDLQKVAASDRPTPEAAFLLPRVLNRLGRRDEALAAFERAKRDYAKTAAQNPQLQRLMTETEAELKSDSP